MAETNNSAKTSFYEVVFRGKPKVVRAFLCGLTLGSGREAQIYYNYLDGVHHEGKAEKLAELVGVRATDCHAIVDRATSDQLKKLKKRIVEMTRLEITSHRRIKSASLAFGFQAFAARYNRQIMDVLDNLPTGLRLKGFKHDVRLDPDAKGVEAYSVAHDYESKGSGQIVGDVDVLIEFRQKLDELPLIKAEDIKLQLA